MSGRNERDVEAVYAGFSSGLQPEHDDAAMQGIRRGIAFERRMLLTLVDAEIFRHRLHPDVVLALEQLRQAIIRRSH